jgi:hypothetical protein
MTRLRDRPTADLVVLFLAVVVGIIVIATVALLLISELVHPGTATYSGVVRSLSDVTNTLIAAIVGFIAGRGAKPGGPPEE